MHMKHNLLEECSKIASQYASLMSQYRNFFNHFLSPPLQAFGYERWTTEDVYFGCSNMPAIAELFIEKNAFEDQALIIQPKHMSSFCTFIYPDAAIHPPKYNDFRISLEEHLQIRVSFCVIRRQLNYCEAFVWNFKKSNSPLLEEKHVIMDHFIKNRVLINACIRQFKKDIHDLLPQKKINGINIRQHSVPYMTDCMPSEYVGDYSQYIELLHCIQSLKQENLTLKDFGLSYQEQQAIELLLETTDIKNHNSEILKKVMVKLEAFKQGDQFENEYHELRRIGLVR